MMYSVQTQEVQKNILLLIFPKRQTTKTILSEWFSSSWYRIRLKQEFSGSNGDGSISHDLLLGFNLN